MGLLRRNPAFPDTLPIGSGYEGLQRREMQQREVSVTQRLVGYVPTIFTDGEGNQWEVLARPIGTGVTATPGKWRLVPVEGSTTQYTLALGNIRDGSSTIAISNPGLVIVPAAGESVYLKRDGGVPDVGTSWTLSLETGAFPGIWELDDDLQTAYAKKLISFSSSQPSVGAQQLRSEIWVQYHTGTGDLAAISTIIRNPANSKAVIALELIPD